MTHSTDTRQHDSSTEDRQQQSPNDDEPAIDEEHPLESIVGNLQGTAEDDDDDDGRLTVGEAVDSLGRRSYGPLLAAPAVVALIPVVGAIPGLSLVLSVLILFVCFQMLIWNEGIWLPKRLRALDIDANKMIKG